MKTIVIYKSISGFTKKYAQLIAQEIDADLSSISDFDFTRLPHYDTIIYGGSLHAVGINGLKTLKKHRIKQKINKPIIVFAVGASPAKEGILEEIYHKNFTPEEKDFYTLFYLRGGFDYNKLDFFNKILMSLLKIKIKAKKKKTSDEIGMLEAYKTPLDFVKKENLKELLAFIKSLENPHQ